MKRPLFALALAIFLAHPAVAVSAPTTVQAPSTTPVAAQLKPEEYADRVEKLLATLDNTPAGLAGMVPFTDDLSYFLNYHRLDPRAELVPGFINELVARGHLNSTPANVSELVRFLAAALAGHGKEIAEVEKIAAAAPSPAGEALKRIVGEAAGFRTPPADSPENMRLIWAEFRATGKEEVLGSIVDVLAQPPSDGNRLIAAAATRSLLGGLITWGDNGYLGKRKDASTGVLKERLDSLMAVERDLSRYSGDLFTQSKNFWKLKNYEEALRSFEKTERTYPYFPRAYSNMGFVYEDKGEKDKAFSLIIKAAKLAPNDEALNFSVGRQYTLRKQWVESIPHFRKAVEGKPHNATYVYNLGRAYWNAGERNQAAPYFKRYLDREPLGEFSSWVRGCLAQAGVTVDPPPPDRASFLRTGNYIPLEEEFKTLLAGREKDENGESRLRVRYEKFAFKPVGAVKMEDWVKYLRDWTLKTPSSHFAHACLGMALAEFAWDARGGGWSSTVVPAGRDLFTQRLQEARVELERAFELDPTDPFPPSRLIGVATGLGLGREEMEKQFKRALAIDPTVITPYEGKLNFLKPKWYGTEAEMFGFARQTAAEAPPQTIIPLVLALAHLEMDARARDQGRNYFDDQEAWRETKAVYKRILADFPKASLLRNQYAKAAYMAHDFEAAAGELEIIGDDWSEDWWGNSNYFQKAKAEIAEKTAGKPR